MSLALETDHMVTAIGFLSWCTTCWTWCAELLHVFERCLFFGVEFGLSSRVAICSLAVPAFLTDGTEGVVAVFAY